MITDPLPLVLGEGAGGKTQDDHPVVNFLHIPCTSSIVIWAYLDIACEGLDRLT